MASAGNIIAAAVVVGAIAGTYALARTLDHIDETIDGVFGDIPGLHDEMKVAAKLGGDGVRGSDLRVERDVIARRHKEADNGLAA